MMMMMIDSCGLSCAATGNMLLENSSVHLRYCFATSLLLITLLMFIV